MARNTMKISQKLEDVVQLINESEVASTMGAAFASFMLNPTVVWAKFILTDDRKNGNGMRIPKEEFANLIRSGIHMPVKMSIGEIAGHDDSKPLGTITHLKEELLPDGRQAIVALAALWQEERPADVRYIKERFMANQPVDISWEILYADSMFNGETDSVDLKETVLRAATIVGDPAYQGRTPVLSVAAKKWSKAYISELADTSFLFVDEDGSRFIPISDSDGNVDRTRLKDALAELAELTIADEVKETKKSVLESLITQFESGINPNEISRGFAALNRPNTEEDKVEPEKLQAELDRVTAELAEAKSALESKETAFAERDALVVAKDEEIAALQLKTEEQETELVALRELKASLDAETERKAKLEEVKNKFSEAEIEKDEAYFEENAEKLIALSAEQLDFMVQELKAFSESAKTLSVSSQKTKIPAFNGNEEGELSPKELGKLLRERNAKK